MTVNRSIVVASNHDSIFDERLHKATPLLNKSLDLISAIREDNRSALDTTKNRAFNGLDRMLAIAEDSHDQIKNLIEEPALKYPAPCRLALVDVVNSPPKKAKAGVVYFTPLVVVDLFSCVQCT